jgi:mono/diheme cytochrome c family protein
MASLREDVGQLGQTKMNPNEAVPRTKLEPNMTLRILFTACGAVLFQALIALQAHAFVANAAKGEVIAKRWCATCHVVSPGQTTANSDVPSFSSLARNQELTPGQLTAFLSTPHPRMPDMSLTRGEIADIVAYIRSLAQNNM